MTLKLFYKEWLKTRWFAIIVTALGLAVVASIFSTVDYNVRLGGSFNYLNRIFFAMQQENYYRASIRLIPLIMAIAIGLSQYMPEVLSKRIKLSLHLPMRNTAVIYNMLLYGFILLLLIYGVVFGTFFFLNNQYFMWEETRVVLISITPWLLGGIAAYFMIAMISMEPNLLYQAIYMVVGYFYVKQFFIGFEHGDTRFIIPALAVMAIVPCFALLYTSNRFMKGER